MNSCHKKQEPPIPNDYKYPPRTESQTTKQSNAMSQYASNTKTLESSEPESEPKPAPAPAAVEASTDWKEDEEHEVYGQEIPVDGEDVDMGAGGDDAGEPEQEEEEYGAVPMASVRSDDDARSEHSPSHVPADARPHCSIWSILSVNFGSTVLLHDIFMCSVQSVHALHY